MWTPIRALLAASILAGILVSFPACSPAPQVNTFPSLANQGALALSTTNPYLGANLFLSREMEQSSYFYNFFKGRGAPTAIEILQQGSEATRILLYYPREKEVYAADLLLEGNELGSRQWVVRGPYGIQRKDFKNLQHMSMSMVGDPVFEIGGKPYRFRQTDDAPSPRIVTALPPPIPTPAPTPRPKKKVVYQGKGDEPVQEVSPRDFRPLNWDQQAIQMAKGFTERAANGDVVHQVKSADETLDAIAKWYTGSGANTAQIAGYNTLQDKQALAVGARITIPLSLVKQFKAMP